MTEMPNRLTLIAMAGAMETLHSMRLESPKDRYTPADAAALCSLAPLAVVAFGGNAPDAIQYVHPNFTTHLSDADIARIADAVRSAPGGHSSGNLGPMPSSQKRMFESPPISRAKQINIDADGQPIVDKGGLE